MHYACNHAHALGITPGFHSDPTSLLSSLGPLGMLGMLFAAVLATLFFLLWTTHREQPAHADIGLLPNSERRWPGEAHPEDGPRISFARYDQAPTVYRVPDEQPQAHYPEMPLDGPPQPGRYD